MTYGSFIDFNFFWTDYVYNAITIELSNIAPKDASLRISIIDSNPETITTLQNSLTYNLKMPVKAYSKIRISWSNDHGVSSTSTRNGSTYDPSLADQSAVFTITVSEFTLDNSSRPSFDMVDAIIIVVIFFCVIVSSSGLTFFLNRFRRRNIRNYEMQDVTTPAHPAPLLFPILIEFNVQKDGKHIPLSSEVFTTPMSPNQLQATTYVIWLPGAQRYLKQGDLPPFGFGTRIVKALKCPETKLEDSKPGIIKTSNI